MILNQRERETCLSVDPYLMYAFVIFGFSSMGLEFFENESVRFSYFLFLFKEKIKGILRIKKYFRHSSKATGNRYSKYSLTLVSHCLT